MPRIKGSIDDEVIFSLKPKYANLIEKGLKNHEFRSYTPKIPPKKIWFYITNPVSSLLYLTEVAPAIKYPQKNKFSWRGKQRI